jgi:hypothetical protein
MRYLIFLLLSVSLACGAAVYMQTDKTGNVSYSDSPSPNSQQVDIPEPSTIQTGTIPSTKKVAASDDQPAAPIGGPTPHTPYTDFTIVSPEDQQTFQNQRDIPVEVEMQPRLQKGDSVQLYVDGQKYRDPWFSPHLAIYLLDRGSHTLYATLLDEGGHVLKTTSQITIFVHYASIKNGQ